jgi:hypothetical protein
MTPVGTSHQTGARARDLPETLLDAASSHPTNDATLHGPSYLRGLRECAVLHGVMNDPRIDSKDVVR